MYDCCDCSNVSALGQNKRNIEMNKILFKTALFEDENSLNDFKKELSLISKSKN